MNSTSRVLKILIINNSSPNDISLKSMSLNIPKEYGSVWKINGKYKVTKKISNILLGMTVLSTQVVDRERFPGCWH